MIKYLWFDVYYSLEDEDDFAIFQTRHSSNGATEVTLLLSSPSIPTSNPSIASISSIPPSASSFSSPPHSSHHHGGHQQLPAHARGVTDSGSVYSSSQHSSFLYGRAELKDQRSETSMHLVQSSEFSNSGTMSVKSGRTGKSGKSRRSEGADTATIGKGSKRTKSLAPTVPEHKIKFEEFHNQVSNALFESSL